ncbi:MAG: SDR family NAD(P)-dependent oxidoreductase [Hyphomonas sp.]|nr:SDR family NAD(P)-dependent oxidoreductase [Hyphomonas sp.]
MRGLVFEKAFDYPQAPSIEGLGRIEITAGDLGIAALLLQALTQAGADAAIADAPGPAANTVIVTDGFSERPPAERHHRALTIALAAPPASRVFLIDRGQAAAPADLGGLSGLAKTIRQEQAGRSVYALTVMTGDGPDAVHAIVSSLAQTDQDLVLGQGAAFHVALGDTLLPPTSAMTAGSDDVWVVTGGARGVTSDCAIEVAQRTGGTFLLLGRSSCIVWPSWLEETDSLPQLRAYLARRAGSNGVPSTPKEIDRYARNLLAGREIIATLARFSEVGAAAHYVQCDLSQPDMIRAAITGALPRGKQVTGIIHGAGVLSDAVVEKQTEATFQTVFGPKVDGLLALMQCVDPGQLRYCGLFSSASAVFGNPGQANYAAANGWLNTYATHLSAAYPSLRVRSFCWGPWEGGMVDEGLARMFAARDISLISRNEGARIFADQLLEADHAFPHLVVGDVWGEA